MSAISYKNLRMVKYLLANGARWDVPNSFTNENAFQLAKRVGDSEILHTITEYL